MKFAFNALGTDGKEYRGVVAAVDLNEAKAKLAFQGYPDIIQINPSRDQTLPESCREVPADEAETETRREMEEKLEREEEEQARQHPQPLFERMPTRSQGGMPLWAKIAAGVVMALVVGGILYAVANNNRAQEKAISALQAQIASLVANPSANPQLQPQVQAAPAGAVPPLGITATNSPQPQPTPKASGPSYVPGPGPGATGSYSAGPYGVVVDNRFTISVDGAGVASTSAAGAAQAQAQSGGDGPVVLKVGQGEYNEFPPYTRVATAVVPSNTTTNNPTAPVIKAIGADRYLIYPRSDVWVKVKYEDGSEREWTHASPVKPLSGSFSQVQAILLAAFDTNAPPVPVRFQFRAPF